MSRKRDISLKNCYRYQFFVSDYDLKQFVKTENIFLTDQLFVFFQSTFKTFLGRGQWRNQGKGAEGTSALFIQVI